MTCVGLIICLFCLEANFDTAEELFKASEALSPFTYKVAEVKRRRFPPLLDARVVPVILDNE
jgi:hypothetical protein